MRSGGGREREGGGRGRERERGDRDDRTGEIALISKNISNTKRDLHREVNVPPLVVRNHSVYMSHTHTDHGEHNRVQVDDGGRQPKQHGVAHPGHEEEKEHLAPTEAQESKQYP